MIQVGGNQVSLRPSVRLSDSELARVQKSQQDGTAWRLYELMPTDDLEVFADLTDDELKAMFPNETTFRTIPEGKYSTYKDYLFHGKIITKEQAETEGLNGRVVMVDEADTPLRNEQGLYTDVEDAQAKGMFLRTLRDYEVLFDEEHRLRSLMIDRIRVAERDLKFLQQPSTIAAFRSKLGRKRFGISNRNGRRSTGNVMRSPNTRPSWKVLSPP